MWASFGSLTAVPWILFAQMSGGMDAVPAITATRPSSEAAVEVRDRGAVFGRGADRRARETLWRIYRDHRIPVHIETIKSLDGAWIADVAGQRARAAGAGQLYILVARNEREVGVIVMRQGPARRLTDQQRETIRRAFLGPLQAGEADEALEHGVRAIGETLDSIAISGQNFTGWYALVPGTVLVAALAVLLAAQRRESYGGRSTRHRRTAAGATALGHIGDSSWASSMVSRVPRATPATDMGEPLCTTRSSTRRS